MGSKKTKEPLQDGQNLGSKKTKEPLQDSQNLGSKKTKEPQQDGQNLGSKKTKESLQDSQNRISCADDRHFNFHIYIRHNYAILCYSVPPTEQYENITIRFDESVLYWHQDTKDYNSYSKSEDRCAGWIVCVAFELNRTSDICRLLIDNSLDFDAVHQIFISSNNSLINNKFG